MLDFQRNILFPTISAAPLPFFQQILANLVAKQRPLLVFHATDSRVLDLLQIKPHRLDRNAGDRAEPLQPFYQRQDVVYPGLQ